MNQTQMLIVEDDEQLRLATKEYFEREGYSVSTCSAGEEAVGVVGRRPPNVVLLDVMLEGTMDGMEVCRELRRFFGGPILMLTARGQDIDQVSGLEVGADDYVVKPVQPRVLLARVRNLVRRHQHRVSTGPTQELFVSGVRLQESTRSVFLGDRELELSTAEFDLLAYLMRRAGRVLSREEIYRDLRGFRYDGLDRWLDIRVSRLRRRLQPLGDDLIKTVRGTGYLFSVRSSNEASPGSTD